MNPQIAVDVLADHIFYAPDGYDRSSKQRKLLVQAMTLAEAKALKYGDKVSMISQDGTVRHLKVNGKVKTWKRNVTRVEVSVKYGLYEYATFSCLSDGTIGNGTAYLVKEVVLA